MSFLKSAALFAIGVISKRNSAMAVSAIERIVEVYKDDQDIRDRAFNALWSFKNNIFASRKAIEICGNNEAKALSVIDKIMQDAPKKYKVTLLMYSLSEEMTTAVKQKAFTALCELSKSEDFAVALDAQETAAELFYVTDDDGQYLYIKEFAPVLEAFAKKNESPETLMPLFAEVARPDGGLERYVEDRYLRKRQKNSDRPDSTIDLMAVFERIDRNNGEKGYPTSLSMVYKLMRDAVSVNEKMWGQVDDAYDKAFHFDQK